MNLPNGTTFGIQCDPKGIGQECLEKVCHDLNIVCETDYFGLVKKSYETEIDSKNKQWLNLRNPLVKHNERGANLELALRVKFWVPVHLILQDSVRNLFYMQARSDLLGKRLMSIDWQNSAKLGALLAQGDDIKFNPASLTSSYSMKSYYLKHNKESAGIKKTDRRRPSKRKSSESGEINCNSCSSSVQSENATNDLIHSQIISPLRLYENYIIRPEDDTLPIPADFLLLLAKEHEKIASMSAQSAKYWLLNEISKLHGFGEEVFNGFVTTNDTSDICDIRVGPHGLIIHKCDETKNIPFSAIKQANSKKQTFSLVYLNEEHETETLEVKFPPKQRNAASLYRAITEKHAFYSCETVRTIVQTQYTRDFKGKIFSMFSEGTDLGKRYVFDIQRTCREVHDNARRILHARGIEINSHMFSTSSTSSSTNEIPLGLGEMQNENIEDHKNAIERAVVGRIAEAWTCRICMDCVINIMFSPCGHVICCATCAEKCERCPLCRSSIEQANKIFLPTELRVSHEI